MAQKVKRKRFLLIDSTIFPHDILISTASKADLIRYIENNKKYKLNDAECERLDLNGNGKTVQLRGGQTIIRLPLVRTKIGIDVPTLAHEIAHAVWLILDRIGVKHTDESDEVFAYYQAFVMRKALEFWDK